MHTGLTNIVTYRLEQPRGRLSENLFCGEYVSQTTDSTSKNNYIICIRIYNPYYINIYI